MLYLSLTVFANAQDQAGEQQRLFIHGSVAAVLYDQMVAVADVPREELLLLYRGQVVLLAGDNEHGAGDSVQPVADVVVDRAVREADHGTG